MSPLKKSDVKSHRETLKKTIPDKKNSESPANDHKKAFAQKYDHSDKLGYKTESSPSTPPAIKFVPNNASPFGFPYAYLQHWYLENENASLILIYSQGVVKITGRNLEELFEYLNAYKVKEIYITGKSDLLPDQTAIESITVKLHREIIL